MPPADFAASLPAIALYQPDIAPNVGAVMRLCACFGAALHVIGPCGFPWDAAGRRRAAMDYAENLALTRHVSWETFAREGRPGRLVLFTTKGGVPLYDFAFSPDDMLLFGRESAGVPDDVHAAADARVFIPLRPSARSLNVGMAAAVALGEAVRQRNNGEFRS